MLRITVIMLLLTACGREICNSDSITLNNGICLTLVSVLDNSTVDVQKIEQTISLVERIANEKYSYPQDRMEYFFNSTEIKVRVPAWTDKEDNSISSRTGTWYEAYITGYWSTLGDDVSIIRIQDVETPSNSPFCPFYGHLVHEIIHIIDDGMHEELPRQTDPDGVTMHPKGLFYHDSYSVEENISSVEVQAKSQLNSICVVE